MSDTYGVTINGEEYEVDAGSPEEAQRKVANLYGQPVPFKEGFRPPVQHTPRELAEGALEVAPAVGGTAGAALGAAPGAALGAAGGEAVRQIGRRALGQPSATGLIQRATGMDPDSPAAAATGIAAEAALGGSAEKIAQAMRWASGALGDWARRSRWGLVRRAANPRDEAKFAELTSRLESEDIAPAFSGRAEQVSRAERRLADARATREAVEASHAGGTVNAEPVLQRAVDYIPEKLPGGEIPQVGGGARSAARRVAEDVETSLRSIGGGGYDVPLPKAMAEKRRWDDILSDFYAKGRTEPSPQLKPSQNAADAWRGAIADAYPDLGAANMRESELITIARLLKEMQGLEARGTAGAAGQVAAGIGAGAAGRTGVPASIFARMGVGGPRVTSLTARGEALLGRLLADPAGQQAYIRMAQLAAFDPDAIRRRREAEKLLAQGEGVTQP